MNNSLSSKIVKSIIDDAKITNNNRKLNGKKTRRGDCNKKYRAARYMVHVHEKYVEIHSRLLKTLLKPRFTDIDTIIEKHNNES